MLIFLNPDNTPVQNTEFLQAHLDKGGTIRLEKPGVYDVTGPLFIGNDTALEFGPGVVIRRAPHDGNAHPFIVNKGLFSHEWNHNIRIEGLHLVTNGVDLTHLSIYPGLRGHLAFLGVRDLVIRDYECLDLTLLGYGIHICSFENVLLERLYIAGDKDGVHLSDGRYFTIRDSRFGTYDDAIALNAYDYCLSTAVYGWVEDGLIENCHDFDIRKSAGHFCRMLGGTWTDWHKGMEVQNSTLAVHNGNLYSVCLPIPPQKRKTPLISNVPPEHTSGIVEWGGVPWRYVKKHDGQYEASCRRITFRDIYLHKPRIAFGFTMEGGLWSNSCPKGLKLPMMEDFVFDGIHAECDLMSVFAGSHPARNIRVFNSTLRGPVIHASVFQDHQASEYPPMDFVFTGVNIPQPAELFCPETTERKLSFQFYGCSGGIPDQPNPTTPRK